MCVLNLFKKFQPVLIWFLINLIGGFPTIVFALPEGGEIVVGQGSIHQHTPQELHIHQDTGSLIVNWQGFNIGVNETVKFFQPNASSIALNPVIGFDPTTILGNLFANGQVFISNPSGINFGPGSQVDVHGLIATTLKISNQDFLNRNYNFAQDPNRDLASILNDGTINASGYVGFLAPAVVNRGTIVANLGSVALASGNAATLDFIGDGLIKFALTEEVSGSVRDSEGNEIADRVNNEGLIRADGGQVTLSALDAGDVIRNVVNQQGIIEARTVIEQEGKIILAGGSQGVVRNSGTLDASGLGAGQQGGTVHVLGEKVGLFDTAHVNVSGDAGGGEVLIGGDFQGVGDVPSAFMTYIGEDTLIEADAITSGDGGKVIAWADDTARIYGEISAHGGVQSGNGGFAETSGKNHLEITRTPDLSAPNGTGGEWLLDPISLDIDFDVDIVAGDVLENITPSSPFTPSTGPSRIGVDLITTALTGLFSVSVLTGGGVGPGNITLNADLEYDDIGVNSLLFSAAGDIILNANIFDYDSTGDRLNLQLVADNEGNGVGDIVLADGVTINPGNGRMVLSANDIELGAGSSIDNSGGLVTILVSDGGTLGLDGGATSSEKSTICGMVCGMTISGDELANIDARQLIFGNTSASDIFVDGISEGDSTAIKFLSLFVDSAAAVNFINNPSVFNSVRVLPGGTVNTEVALTIKGPGIGLSNVLLIDDLEGGFGDTAQDLIDAGHKVSEVTGEFGDWLKLTDPDYLELFDFVVWAARGDETVTPIPGLVFTTLEAYIQGGGNLLVTGADSLGFPPNQDIADLVRSASADDQASFSGDWQISSEDNFILNGAFGDIRNLSFSSVGYDDDFLLPGPGAVTLASTPEFSDRVIYTDLDGGSVGYWNGGQFEEGSNSNAQPDFTGNGVLQDFFLNWVSGVGTGDSVIPPADVEAEATALLSLLDIGTATGTPEVTENAPDAGFPLGTTLVNWTGIDTGGNLSTATQTVTVDDTIAPVITPPEPIVVVEGAPIVLDPATAFDLVDPSPTVTSDAPDIFTVGTTVVTFTAVDAAGNVATATQTVTVTGSPDDSLEIGKAQNSTFVTEFLAPSQVGC